MAFEWDDKRKEYVEVIKIANPEDLGVGGGGEFDGTVEWGNVTNKPQTYPPSEHIHDDRYYTKEESENHVNFVRDLMEQEQGKIAFSASDSLDYLGNKVDNLTVVVDGNELKVISIEGLTVGVADISEWLTGTEGNIQSQINGLESLLEGISGGMKFKGIAETRAEMDGYGNSENGDVIVVLADETRDDGRSMYVYSEDLGMWRYLGTFTFSTSFTALQDTPNTYENGKYLKSTNSGIVYGDVDYQDIANKPQSTITQIDDAVEKRHEHANKDVIDGVGESSNGILTYRGIEYVRKDELSSVEKDYLFLGKDGNKTISGGDPLSFDLFYAGNMEYTDTTFTLQANKVYRVVASVLFTNLNRGLGMRLRDVTNGIYAAEYPDAKWFYSARGDGTTNGNGVFDFIIKPTTTKQFQIIVTSVSGEGTVTQYNRNSTLSIHEI